jgi:hypothetical protein
MGIGAIWGYNFNLAQCTRGYGANWATQNNDRYDVNVIEPLLAPFGAFKFGIRAV